MDDIHRKMLNEPTLKELAEDKTLLEESATDQEVADFLVQAFYKLADTCITLTKEKKQAQAKSLRREERIADLRQMISG